MIELERPEHLVSFATSTRPMLMICVHTEEEFDWSAPFDRANTGVSHIASIGRVQQIFDESGVRPAYLAGYPVAQADESVRVLRAIADDGRCVIGAHLHPWVCPPFEEEVCARNSYPGNLAAELEFRKIAALTDKIRAAFGVAPIIYLAGRHGRGPNTADILRRLGYLLDVSPSAGSSFRADGGPHYRRLGCEPFWDGPDRQLLSVPHTGGHTGALTRGCKPAADLEWLAKLRPYGVYGVLWRLNVLRHIRLSPEDSNLASMEHLTRMLVAGGSRVFVASFHSPSVVPGLTPYIRSPEDLSLFLETLRGFFRFFADEIGGRFVTPAEVFAAAKAA